MITRTPAAWIAATTRGNPRVPRPPFRAGRESATGFITRSDRKNTFPVRGDLLRMLQPHGVCGPCQLATTAGAPFVERCLPPALRNAASARLVAGSNDLKFTRAVHPAASRVARLLSPRAVHGILSAGSLAIAAARSNSSSKILARPIASSRRLRFVSGCRSCRCTAGHGGDVRARRSGA